MNFSLVLRILMVSSLTLTSLFAAQIESYKLELYEPKNQTDNKTKTHLMQASINCSSEKSCSCIRLQSGGILAKCSSLGLTSIPEFSDDVLSIDLSHNDIQRFPNTSRFPGHLTLLILSNNLLVNFANDPFKGLTHLLYLDLNGNKFQYNPFIFKNGIFRDLKSLQVLKLKGNNKDDNAINYPLEITKIKTLQELHLDGLRNGIFSPQYKSLINISRLDFAGEEFHSCKTKSLTSTFLINFPSIKYLNLSWCDLRHVEKDSLRHLTNLTTLDLSYNVFLSFRILRNLTFGLQYTNIKHLDLTYLHCPAGLGSMIIGSDLEYLRNTSLTDLNLSFNRVQIIDDGVVKVLPKSLKIINLSQNHIDTISLRAILDITKMPNIEKIDLSHQGNHLHSVRVSNQENCHDWRGPYPLKTVQKSRFNLNDKLVDKKSLKSNNRVGLTVYLQVSQSLKELNLDSVGITQNEKNSKFQVYFSKNNNIDSIDMRRNSVHVLGYELKGLHALTYLNINLNHCSQMLESALDDFPSLRYLYMEDNSLGSVLSKENGGRYFKYLKNLTHLYLGGNHISHIPTNVFHALSKLEVLSLVANELSEWDSDISHMSQLCLLDLSVNRIQTLNQKTRNAIDLISKSSELKINLFDNSLQCNCENLDFLIWINNRKELFLHFDKTKCFYATNNQSVVSFSDLDKVIENLQIRCSEYSGLIVGVLLSIFVVLFIIGAAIIYRYRWKLRYLYFMTKKGHRPIKEADTSFYEFNAFVSYANEDGDFVERELLEEMEQNYGLKLILHRRDFIPGNAIAENITDSIHLSHKTVIMLSTKYLQSYWCMFEFNMARMESIYSRGGEPTIFIVLLEDIKPRDLPLMMLDVINSESYIKVPDVRNNEFWGNVYKDPQ